MPDGHTTPHCASCGIFEDARPPEVHLWGFDPYEYEVVEGDYCRPCAEWLSEYLDGVTITDLETAT